MDRHSGLGVPASAVGENRPGHGTGREDCRQAVLNAGCYADYAAANAAHAGIYSAKAAMTSRRAKEETSAVAEAVAEAGAASSLTDGGKARRDMHLACSYIVRTRIHDDLIVSAWRRFCAVKQ
jgi:hypothetical protein